MNTNGSSGKNLEIEVLRGFAILFTLLVHFKALLHGESGIHELLAPVDLSVGVDLFLVISGYVITSSVIDYAKGYAGPSWHLMLAFWVKRIFRLLPPAWVWILFALFAQLTIMALTDMEYSLASIARETGAALFNVMNWYTPYCVAQGGGEHCIFGNWLGHYWSLSLEEQFYLVFPLLFFWLPRKLFAVILVSAIAAQFFWHRPFPTYAWYFKTDALCWGILLALAARRGYFEALSDIAKRYPMLVKCLGAVLLVTLPLVAANIQGIGSMMKPWGVATVAIICAAIVLLASLQQGAFMFGTAHSRLMLYLGDRSYALYLAHLIVYFSTRDSFKALNFYAADLTATLAMLIIALSMTVGGAEVTHRYLEHRLRLRGRRIAARLLSRAD